MWHIRNATSENYTGFKEPFYKDPKIIYNNTSSHYFSYLLALKLIETFTYLRQRLNTYPFLTFLVDIETEQWTEMRKY